LGKYALPLLEERIGAGGAAHSLWRQILLNFIARRAVLATAVALAAVLPVHRAAADQTIRVGIMSAEDEDVWAVVSKEAAKQGLTLKLVTFNDYTQPNEALENGDLDANAFQHKPYLDNQIKTRGYHIVPVGYTAVWPIGLYSHKHKSIAELPAGAVIGVPNDPSNEGRALNLLQAQGLIKLKPDAGILATTADITDNPKKIEVKELDAGIVGRSIDDLDAAVVNTDWALKSNLTQQDRLATEAVENNPYRNFIAVKDGHQNDPWVKTLVAAYQNDTVKEALKTIYKGTALPAW
jgi:D-methionine transport system substrate-binding protein